MNTMLTQVVSQRDLAATAAPEANERQHQSAQELEKLRASASQEADMLRREISRLQVLADMVPTGI
jgi:hypothetical protein